MSDIQQTTTVGLAPEEIKKICRGLSPHDRTAQLLCVVDEELRAGFALLKRHPKVVTFLGSARTPSTDFYYQDAKKLGGRIVTELGSDVATGGGGGIMEAASAGGYEAKGGVLGMTIELPHEQKTNIAVTDLVHFHFFFTRKVIMTYGAEAFIFYPGGFGTLNEFFEIITLIQTHKMRPTPVFLVGVEYWTPLQQYIFDYLDKREMIDDGDPRVLYKLTDNHDEIIASIRDFYQNAVQ